MGNEGGQNSWGNAQAVSERGAGSDDRVLNTAEQVADLSGQASVFEPGDSVVENTETDSANSDWAKNARVLRDTPEKERNLTESAVELSADLNELKHPLETVGESSQLQVTEYLKDDAEDLTSEAGKGFVGKLVVKNQEGITKAIVPEMNKIVNQKSYKPADVLKVYRKGRGMILAVFDRKIGDRNNAA